MSTQPYRIVARYDNELKKVPPANPAVMWIRWFKLLGLLSASWCVMVITHEGGHVIGGVLAGGTLRHADLRPWTLPHSHFDPDPYPLLTLWAGPLLGVLVPVAIAAAIRRRWAWFIGNFCLLGNGAYLAVAWVNGGAYLDTPRLLAEGAAPAQIVAYCLLTIGFGYARFRSSCREVLGSDRKGV
jgi:hypothetical protein